MKKKVYVALLSLCCPIMLNTQQVFAEEAGAENAPTSETVVFEDQLSENGPEELPVEQAPEVSEEAPEVTEEATEAVEETVAEEAVESTEVAEEVIDVVEETAEKSARALVSFTVTFVDETTNAVIGSVPVNQEENTTAVIVLPTNGYFVVDTPVGSGFSVELDDNMTPHLVGPVTATTTDFTVTMRAFNASGDAQINFVDEAGNPVAGAPSVTLGGEVGEVFSYDPPVIPGYTYSGGTVTGTLTDTLQTINVVYTRIETTLTVTYLDEAGNQLIPDEVYTGKFGEVYTFTPASFWNKEMVSFNGMATSGFAEGESVQPIGVTFLETDQHYVLVYRDKPVVTDPGQPSQVQPVNTVVEVRPVVKAMYDKKILPETGEKENMVAAAAGMILVAQAAYILKKKKENEFGL